MHFNIIHSVRFLTIASTLVVLTAISVPTVWAQTPDPCGDFGCFEVLDQLNQFSPEAGIGKSISEFVKKDSPLVTIANIIFQIGLAILVAVSLVFIIIGGYVYMTAGGDSSKIASAKTYIISALLGMVLGLIGWLILNTISTQFTQPTDPTKLLNIPSTPP